MYSDGYGLRRVSAALLLIGVTCQSRRLIAAASTNTPVERDWRFASLATREASQAKQPRRNPAVTAVSEDTAIVAVRPGATCAVHPAGEDAANDLPETLQRARP
jgi:hypothetical protein